jgi:hypothetical protein
MLFMFNAFLHFLNACFVVAVLVVLVVVAGVVVLVLVVAGVVDALVLGFNLMLIFSHQCDQGLIS